MYYIKRTQKTIKGKLLNFEIEFIMKKIFYYAPIIRPIAANGSDRLGVQIVTIMWQEDNPDLRMELTKGAKTSSTAKETLISFLNPKNEYELVELPCEYYLCSKSVVDKFKPFEVSKPIISGYHFDKDDDDRDYVAWLNFDEVQKHYYDIVEPGNQTLENGKYISFWARECIEGTMDVSKITISGAKKYGFYVEIEEKLSITAERNRAMVIFNMAKSKGITPVQLIDKIHA